MSAPVPVPTTTGELLLQNYLEAMRYLYVRAFLGRGKMVRPTHYQNTTISALITLRHVGVGMRQYRTMVKKYPDLDVEETLAAAAKEFPNFDIGEKQLGVIVWENAVARIALSRELFTGPYDERWGYEDGYQSIIFRGEKLAELSDDDEK